MMTTALWDVENAQSVGVSATYTYGRQGCSTLYTSE